MLSGFTASIVAGLLLLLRELLPDWKGLPRTVADILVIAGAGKSQAYEMRDRLRELLPTLMGSPGRPASPPLDQSAKLAVIETVRDYVWSHPGAINGTGERWEYTEGFRRCVVGLASPGRPGEGMSVAELASACGIPASTLKEWMRRPPRPDTDTFYPHGGANTDPGAGAVTAVQAATATNTSPPTDDTGDKASPIETESEAATEDLEAPTTIRGAHARTIIGQWPSWRGTFHAFCQMLRTEHRVPYGDTFIGNFLQSLGLRHRHVSTPIEAPWSSGTFRTLFPGAQWLGDGTSIAVYWGTHVFVFNVEALHDPAADATVGFDISNCEDEETLRLAYEAACETTGVPPLAVTLDNRPSNHSPGAAAALGDTILLRSTPGRGQAKAPLEGAFGLFQQAMPPLVLPGGSQGETARAVLHLILTAWFRGRNGKPRQRLKGRSPAEAYAGARPTPEEIEDALKWFRELQRRQERARLTREARRDPVRIQLLIQGLAELGIPDPNQRLTIALAGYAREAIARGLATFRTKQDNGTLPPGADHGRYLGGIIRHLHTRLELEQLSVHLLEQRIRLRDFTLEPLRREAEQIRAEFPASALPEAFADRALNATYTVDFHYWARNMAEAYAALTTTKKAALYQPLCRHIAATFKTDRERRADLIDRLAETLASAG